VARYRSGMHRNSLLLFKRYAQSQFKSGMRVLEVGPSLPSDFEPVVADPSIRWETIDIYKSPKLTYQATGEYSFPLPDQGYDIVMSAQVIEHVRAPWKWMRELARVCRVGGKIITINPVNWGYHKVPIDCWRMYPDAIKTLHAEAGIETEFCTFESLEDWGDRLNWPALKWTLRKLLRRPESGEPFFPIDTISVGRRLEPGASSTAG
jgi:SAM-dependent methyltransferase